MNIIINKEERDFLEKSVKRRFSIGSQLYQTNNENSDSDILSIYLPSTVELMSGLPNFHQFQWKDTENNIDWLYTSELQFWKNFYSGDSTINTDIVLFTDLIPDHLKLSYCRTYKIIKAYIGFAKRDLKQLNKDKSKLFHANRGLYCAEELLENKLPLLTKIKKIYQICNKFTDVEKLIHIEKLVYLEDELRRKLNKLYDDNKIVTFYIEKCGTALFDKMLEANNIKEFKY
jgi:predicted nucleotidyltransferase